MDYQSNANKGKESPKIKEKQIEKVVTGEVVQKPKTIRRKFRDIFFGGDIKVASRYVAADVLLPALRNLIVNVITSGIESVVYGDNISRSRLISNRPRVQYTQYSNPIHRDPRSSSLRLVEQSPRRLANRREVNDIILATREEAELVVENLINVIDKYEVASLADLYDLLGLPTSHVDNKWGWTYLNNVEIRQIRDGYLIDLPPLEEI